MFLSSTKLSFLLVFFVFALFFCTTLDWKILFGWKNNQKFCLVQKTTTSTALVKQINLIGSFLFWQVIISFASHMQPPQKKIDTKGALLVRILVSEK